MQTIKRKSMLYKSAVEYGDYCINHVKGCSHGCLFPCYAMSKAIRFKEVKDYKDWVTPKIVENAMELLEKEIPKHKAKIKFVEFCFSTDPFMYKYPEIGDLTLKIIERLNQDKIRAVVLTKGVYPKNLVDTKKYGKTNEYGITLVSLDENYKKTWEPFAAPLKDRIKSLKYLHSKGLKTWISMEPYPTPNIVKQNLSVILNKISFVDKIVFGRWNYNKITSKSVFPEGDNFYDACAKAVVNFCKKNKISYHIKDGTQKTYDKETRKLFIKRSAVKKVI